MNDTLPIKKLSTSPSHLSDSDVLFLVVAKIFPSTATTALLFQHRNRTPQVSSPLMTFFRKFSSAFERSNSSWLTVTRFCFCASVSRRGTNFAATRRIFSLSVKIWWHELLQIPTSSATSRAVRQRFWRAKQALSQRDRRPLTWKAVQIWGRLRWTFCPIWNAGTNRDIAYGSNNPLHKPVATSEKSP